VNSPEDGPVGPKHVEIRRYMNKIEIVTSVGFSFHMLTHKVTGEEDFEKADVHKVCDSCATELT
jgi:hypothetical protein